MRELDRLHDKYHYADGGKVSMAKGALAAVQQALAHVEAGNHDAALQTLKSSPAAMAHPEVQAAAKQLVPSGTPAAAAATVPGANRFGRPPLRQGGDDLLTQAALNPPAPIKPATSPMQPGWIFKKQAMADGGEVRNSSSPGSPGIGGAISDAASAIKDYFIDSPARQVAHDRMRAIDSQIEQATNGNVAPEHAQGGRIAATDTMYKYLRTKVGMGHEEAARHAVECHDGN